MEYGTESVANQESFAFEFAENITKKGLNDPIFLCVGNSNVVGDLFGPLCGEILKTKYKFKYVFGDLKNNITSKNLIETYKFIKSNFPLNPICVIDASLCDVASVGMLKFLPYGCLPACNSNTKVMGDFSILGCVNVTGISGLMFLRTVKFEMVLSMCEFACFGINRAIELMSIIKNYSNKKAN